MTEFDTAIQLITQVGFPIFTALYFMLRLEKTVQNNTEVLNQIKVLMEGCKKP